MADQSALRGWGDESPPPPRGNAKKHRQRAMRIRKQRDAKKALLNKLNQIKIKLHWILVAHWLQAQWKRKCIYAKNAVFAKCGHSQLRVFSTIHAYLSMPRFSAHHITRCQMVDPL